MREHEVDLLADALLEECKGNQYRPNNHTLLRNAIPQAIGQKNVCSTRKTWHSLTMKISFKYSYHKLRQEMMEDFVLFNIIIIIILIPLTVQDSLIYKYT